MTTQPKRTRFSTFVKRHRNGMLDVDATEALADVVEAAHRTGKAATLTVRITVKPDGEVVAVTDKIATSIPAEDDARIYWIDLDGNLTRRDPLQPALAEELEEEAGRV